MLYGKFSDILFDYEYGSRSRILVQLCSMYMYWKVN